MSVDIVEAIPPGYLGRIKAHAGRLGAGRFRTGLLWRGAVFVLNWRNGFHGWRARWHSGQDSFAKSWLSGPGRRFTLLFSAQSGGGCGKSRNRRGFPYI
jgi:hypothetical protein